MFEALRGLRPPWLADREDEAPPLPVAPTPLEEAESLIATAKAPGQIERTSDTWKGVARWAANELILARTALETATDERAAALRARARTLRDLLAIDERAESKTVVEDRGPDIP